MKAIVALCSLGLLLAAAGCRQHDYRTITIQVPEMRDEACTQFVGRALLGLPGLEQESVSFDTANGTVTLTYDTLLAADKNAEYLIADAGFAVDSVSRGTPFRIPANPEAMANLPPECRP